MAGEIFIADKATLDTINTKVGNASDTGGSTSAGSLMSKINKNISDTANLAGIMTSTRGGYIDNVNTKVNALAANMDRKGFIAAELITTKKFVMRTVDLPAATNMTNMLNITGSGYLYLAVMSYGGDEYNTNTMEMTVTSDGIVICNKKISNPTADGTTGIITPNALLRGYGGDYYLAPSGNSRFNFANNSIMESPSSAQSTSQAIIYIPKPVRFTNGLKLDGRVSGSYPQYCSFMYELD